MSTPKKSTLIQTSRTFVKKTPIGTAVRVLREHYLRTDLTCGSAICTDCDFSNEYAEICLEAEPFNKSDLCPDPHYIIPDSNVIIHQIDVLMEPVFTNVIILQTVAEETKHRRSPAYNKLRQLLANKERHFYAFINEHHCDTYVERETGESSNDRNDRAIRHAAKWYGQHLKKIKVILLTNDRDNYEKAVADGIPCYTFAEYVASMRDHPSLIDKLAQTTKYRNDGEEFIGKPKNIYPDHWTSSKIQEGLKAGTLCEGKFEASIENYYEGYVSVGGEDGSDSIWIFIRGRDNLNRAIHGDDVAIRILPEKEKFCWPFSPVFKDDDDDEETVLKRASHCDLSGTVVGIIKKNWRPYCGVLQPQTIEGPSIHYLFVPSDCRIPKIRIQTKQGEILLSKRIIVSIDSWPRNSKYPQGHYVQTLGEIGEIETENRVLLIEHDIPHHPFSIVVHDCLPDLPWVITDEDIATRRDLRHIAICSVDPPGCTDINDALHCRRLENGNLEVGVHVADVSHFIRPGTAIDTEAAMRGTTVYLVDKQIDMVPELLSSNFCSLRENEERFAFSVIWEMTEDAEILRSSYFKSIIKSKAALTYAEAQMRIDDLSLNDDITISLRFLNSLAKILKRKRINNGALSLASTEVRFAMDTETHDPIDLDKKELKETNFMVEEFVLLANCSVAQRILKEFPDCALLRRHPAPELSHFELLIKAGLSKGFEMKVDTNKTLAESLDNAVVPENPYFNVMLRMVAARCMASAFYFSSGVSPSSDYYHYGLAVPIYTHFTSPIRRYSDIIVQRLLSAAIGVDVTYPDLVDTKKTQELCNNLNYCINRAQYCGRESLNLYTHIFFKDKVIEEEGYILFVEENDLQIILPRFGLECTLYLHSLNEENDNVMFEYDEKESSQCADGVALRQFDPVTVQLHIDKSDVQHQEMVLKLVKPHIPNFSVPPLSEEPATKKLKL